MRENEGANEMLFLSLSSLHELLLSEELHHLVCVALVCSLHLLHHWWNGLRCTRSLVPVVLHWLRHLLLLRNSRAHAHTNHRLRWCLILVIVLGLILRRIAILLLWVVLAIGHSCHAILVLEPGRIHVHLIGCLLPTALVVVQLAHEKTK